MTGHPTKPRPFLKWAGGKAEQAEAILAHVAVAGPTRTYVEPFLGGGATALLAIVRLRPEQVVLADRNAALVEAYQVVQQHVEPLIDLLRAHADQHDRDHYYAVRAALPDDPIARAARLIYLNKTCFNGLYRVNRKGGFNVPLGRPRSGRPPTIADAPRLREAHRALQGVCLRAGDFEERLVDLGPGDAVYLDPPYVPLSSTASFTRYDGHRFADEDQRRLATRAHALVDQGVRVVASNHDTPDVRRWYRSFAFHPVQATRRISRRAQQRTPAEEVVMVGGEAR